MHIINELSAIILTAYNLSLIHASLLVLFRTNVELFIRLNIYSVGHCNHGCKHGYMGIRPTGILYSPLTLVVQHLIRTSHYQAKECVGQTDIDIPLLNSVTLSLALHDESGVGCKREETSLILYDQSDIGCQREIKCCSDYMINLTLAAGEKKNVTLII